MIYNTDGQIKFKTMISSQCDYSDAYILLSETITVVEGEVDDVARPADKINKQAAFRICTSFIDCITEINNTQVDNAKDLDVAMSMYKLIGYSDNYSKTSVSLWQYCKVEPNNKITESESFKSKLLHNTCLYYRCKNSFAIKILKVELPSSRKFSPY